jgi:hypothetical protein
VSTVGVDLGSPAPFERKVCLHPRRLATGDPLGWVFSMGECIVGAFLRRMLWRSGCGDG